MSSTAVIIEAVRLLHMHSEHGYTDRLDLGLNGEPEAVSADYQAYLTGQAHRTAAQRKLDAWHSARATITAALDDVADDLGLDVSSDLRVIVRQIERIDRRLHAA